ncbi:Nramp-domain-containing protein [Jaminaea rosea]|uniref:Nramp-domain-containing protein n=1 Tax=Jaminaea rosea TaxID=1569628 RepID=A0A316UVT3_9BASI|nr:Nramp-domain-containing protein [Jaminaea rosea]PWN28033.1 Nramp-domain-containing protein [Jaminaea rosea]
MNYASPFSTTPLRGPLPVLNRAESSWRSDQDGIQMLRRPSRPGDEDDAIDVKTKTADDPQDGGGGQPPGAGSDSGIATVLRRGRGGGQQQRQGDSARYLADRPPKGRWDKFKWFLKMQLKYLGPGITMSVAYCDPGNWSTDLQAGSQFGYPLLFVILLTGIFGIILQVLSLRMGIVCNEDLAVLTRRWVMSIGKSKKPVAINRDRSQSPSPSPMTVEDPSTSTSTRHSVWAHRSRVGLLWTLYLVAEGAIICTELAELVGSAIALTLLFPKLPLWGGVLITSADVFLILFIYRPDTKGLRAFEFCIGVLVLIVISCLVALVVKVEPHWPDVFHGYLPSAAVVGPQALYVGIGILGATCMPHGLFLGSHFAMFEREEHTDREAEVTAAQERRERRHDHDTASNCEAQREAQHVLPVPSSTSTVADKGTRARRLRSTMHRLARRIPGVDPSVLGITTPEEEQAAAKARGATPPPPRPPPTLRSLNRRLLHSTIDVTASMILFALTTNSALLIVAAQAFYFGLDGSPANETHGNVVVGDLFEAFDLLSSRLNHASAILFAVALLAAGQSASITVTLAGQVISEGMIKWRTNPFLRRCLTRGITLIPSFVVAAAVGRGGLDRMLVASQVALSMALPFVLAPLLVITAQEKWMVVKIRDAGEAGEEDDATGQHEEAAPQATQTTDGAGVRQSASSWWTRLTRGRGKPQQRRRLSFSLRPEHTRSSSSLSSSSSEDEREGREALPAAAVTGAPSRMITVVHYASSWPLVAVTAAIFTLIVLCDGFVLITTALGTGGAA